MMAWKRWAERWSASWAKSLQKRPTTSPDNGVSCWYRLCDNGKRNRVSEPLIEKDGIARRDYFILHREMKKITTRGGNLRAGEGDIHGKEIYERR